MRGIRWLDRLKANQKVTNTQKIDSGVLKIFKSKKSIDLLIDI